MDGRVFLYFLGGAGVGLCPGDQVKGRELGRVLLRGEPSMLAQSNKLVGITRAMESRWWRRRRSPPARPRHQLAELNPAPGLSSMHIHTFIHSYTYVHISRGFGISLSWLPLSRTRIHDPLESIAATLSRTQAS